MINRLKSFISLKNNLFPFQRNRSNPERESIYLGIETSCDDTGIAFLNKRGKILGASLSSQFDVHNQFGGIRPNWAVRAHEKNFQPTLDLAMERAGLKDLSSLKGLGVTVGPGMRSCLSIGLERGKEISRKHSIPLFPINHLEGHSLMVRLPSQDKEDSQQIQPNFPYLMILVSGGHSQILLCKGVGDYFHLGGTMDDSLGETFDKIARLLGFSFEEGGKGLEKLALEGDENVYSLPSPLSNKKKSCDLSFSGLKTSTSLLISRVRTELSLLPEDSFRIKARSEAANIAATFQDRALKHVISSTMTGLKYCRENLLLEPTCIVISGGVASNQRLRNLFQEKSQENNISVHFPPMEFCTDNGIMIAWATIESSNAGIEGLMPDSPQFEELGVRSKWPLDSEQREHLFGLVQTKIVTKKRRGEI